MVIAGVADRIPARLAHLVYLDAFVPGDGDRLIDLLPPERRAYFEQLAADRGEGFVPPLSPAALGVIDPEQARWVERLVTPQPLATFLQPVRLGT